MKRQLALMPTFNAFSEDFIDLTACEAPDIMPPS
jgi:hypothetical protein